MVAELLDLGESSAAPEVSSNTITEGLTHVSGEQGSILIDNQSDEDGSATEKTTTGKSFTDIPESGLSKAADTALSAGGLAAPNIPGGSVISAALDGHSQSQDSDTSPDTPNLPLDVNGDQENPERLAEIQGQLSASELPRDVNALVQSELRESYLENTQDLAFHAEKVKYFNQCKDQIRSYLSDMREGSASISAEEVLEIPVTTTELTVEGNKMEVKQTLIMTVEQTQDFLSKLDQPQESEGEQNEVTRSLEVEQNIADSITGEVSADSFSGGRIGSDPGSAASGEIPGLPDPDSDLRQAGQLCSMIPEIQ